LVLEDILFWGFWKKKYFCGEIKNRNIMASITLEYDYSDVKTQKTLDYVLSLGLFRPAITGNKEEHISERMKKEEAPFSQSFGMWADRDIDIKKIRQKAYERRTTSYDNGTL
jgi:hypothetical protein